METNIDDMNPEIYSYLVPLLFENGAKDVFVTPVIMKKNRPGNILTILCETKHSSILEDIIFTETSTLGIRKYPVERSELKRTHIKLDTDFGIVKVKAAYSGSRLLKIAPEYEQCKKIAMENNIPLKDVYTKISVAAGQKMTT